LPKLPATPSIVQQATTSKHIFEEGRITHYKERLGQTPSPVKMNHVTSPNEPYPTPSALGAATKTHAQSRFRVSTRKLPISKSGAIDEMTERIGIPIPEMIFGDNLVRIAHEPTGWALRFTAPEALDCVDKTDKGMLKVAYARDWESTRENTTSSIKEVVKPYDWSYSTNYMGTVQEPPSTSTSTSSTSSASTGVGAGACQFQPTDRKIPIELLKRRDPILFFDDVVLYESELDDNGISIYSAKLRVHEKRMLLLCRLFMRLDNVLVRMRDTRVYVDFETDEVIREYTAKESSFEDVKRVSCQNETPARLPPPQKFSVTFLGCDSRHVLHEMDLC
jgi:type 2A phosphatase activator TIP41